MNAEMIELVRAEVARQMAERENPETRARLEEDRAALERGKLHIEGQINAALARDAMITQRREDPERFYTACREVLDEITPEFEALRASIVEANKTGANRRPFERQLDALEQVLDGLMRGKWDESGDLEDRLRAKGVPSSSPKYFSNRRSLARTQAVIEAWRSEQDANTKHLANLREQLAEVNAKLSLQ